jgi:hypothetical protein
MEAIIGVLGGLLASGAIYLFKKYGVTAVVKNYGTVIEKAFNVLDPIAGNLMNGYNDSEVQQAIQLIVTRVGDSTLDESDVVAITNYVIEKFNPSLAAAKVLDKDSEEGRASLEIIKNVKALQDGASIEEIFAIARNAKALL